MSKENKDQSENVQPINVMSVEMTFDNPIKDSGLKFKISKRKKG